MATGRESEKVKTKKNKTYQFNRKADRIFLELSIVYKNGTLEVHTFSRRDEIEDKLKKMRNNETTYALYDICAAPCVHC